MARGVQMVLQRYKDLQDMIAILGMDELSEEDKLIAVSYTHRDVYKRQCSNRSSYAESHS